MGCDLPEYSPIDPCRKTYVRRHIDDMVQTGGPVGGTGRRNHQHMWSSYRISSAHSRSG
jgi:hypothetical protein